MYRILIVEDDAVIARAIASHLTRWGYAPEIVEDFQAVDEAFARFDPQLVLMDISLPYYNGFYWCGEIRKRSAVPVVFLSSRAESMDIVMAMNMGGDDYITKPFSMEVLLAKLQAVLRRSYAAEAAPPLLFCGAQLFPAECCVARGGERAELTRNELRILQMLLENRGRVVSREALMERLWNSDCFIDDNTLTVNVNRLRKTLAGIGLAGCIVTHKGEGYAIADEGVS